MLAPRRGCLGYSKVYCNIRKKIYTYYIFHIQYTNSKISIGLLYIRPTSFDDTGIIIVWL